MSIGLPWQSAQVLAGFINFSNSLWANVVGTTPGAISVSWY
jgi:hypothetical protein